jgi:hypothetical protein
MRDLGRTDHFGRRWPLLRGCSGGDRRQSVGRRAAARRRRARAVHDIMVNWERGCARGAGTISAARPAPDMNACAQCAWLLSSSAKFCTSCREPVTLEDQDEAPPAAPDAPPVYWPSPGPSAAPVSSSPPGPSALSPPPRKPAVRTPTRPATRSSRSPRSTSHRRVWMLEAADRERQNLPAFMEWSGKGNVSTLHMERSCRVCGEGCRRRQSMTTSTSMRWMRSDSHGIVTSRRCHQRSQPLQHDTRFGRNPKHLSCEQRKQEDTSVRSSRDGCARVKA